MNAKTQIKKLSRTLSGTPTTIRRKRKMPPLATQVREAIVAIVESKTEPYDNAVGFSMRRVRNQVDPEGRLAEAAWGAALQDARDSLLDDMLFDFAPMRSGNGQYHLPDDHGTLLRCGGKLRKAWKAWRRARSSYATALRNCQDQKFIEAIERRLDQMDRTQTLVKVMGGHRRAPSLTNVPAGRPSNDGSARLESLFPKKEGVGT